MASTKPTLTVYRDVDMPGQFAWSPFVTKLETRLRFAMLPYSAQLGSLSQSPTGKLPYVQIEYENGEAPSVLSDSCLITKNFCKSNLMADLNTSLTPAQKAMDLAVRALLEDKIYWMTVHERWMENYYVMRDQGPLSGIPYFIRIFVGMLVHSKITRTLHGQGTGRYSPAELKSLMLEAWTSLDALLAESSNGGGKSINWVLGGGSPTDADACLFGFLASLLTTSANPEVKATIQGLPHLLAYADRICEEYFPDYKKWE